MTIIGSLIVFFGLGIAFLGSIFFLIAAARQSILWLLGVLFVPFAGLVFLVLHWDRARNPFFLMLWGWGLILLGAMVFHAALPWPLG